MTRRAPSVMSLISVALSLLTVACSTPAEHSGVSPTSLEGPWPIAGDDNDHDYISDSFEMDLAKRWQPIVQLNNDKAYRPVHLKDVFKRNGDPSLVLQEEREGGWPTVHDPISFGQFSQIVSDGKTNSRMKVWSHFNWENGKPPIESKPDLFVHVNFVDHDAKTVSIQYFWFCTFSDADFPANGGDHDGDWLCVELWVSPTKEIKGSGDIDRMKVQKVIFHNHGRQLVGPASACSWDGTRLVVYTEHNSNEPWPMPGGSGEMDIPNMKKTAAMDSRVIRDHWGRGTKPVREWEVINVDEEARPGTTEEAQVFMRYEGLWGKRAGAGADLSRSPRFQDKMWKRDFSMP